MALLDFNDATKKYGILYSSVSHNLQIVLIEIRAHPGYQKDLVVYFLPDKSDDT
jgi:hypothetical protein